MPNVNIWQEIHTPGLYFTYVCRDHLHQLMTAVVHVSCLLLRRNVQTCFENLNVFLRDGICREGF